MVVLTLPSKAGSAISVCNVVVSPTPHVFPCRRGRVLALIKDY